MEDDGLREGDRLGEFEELPTEGDRDDEGLSEGLPLALGDAEGDSDEISPNTIRHRSVLRLITFYIPIANIFNDLTVKFLEAVKLPIYSSIYSFVAS